MKIRTDFVTNSSSSSFILSFDGFDNNKLTIEDAYQVIYQMYINYYHMINTVIDLVNTDPNSRMYFNEDGNLRFKNGKGWWNDPDNKQYFEELQTKVGVEFDEWEIKEERIEWIPLCPTYKDYVKYWTKKVYTKDPKDRTHAPFDICDYRSNTMDVLHYRRCYYDSKAQKMVHFDTPEEIIDKTLNNDELSWYFPYLEDFFEYDSVEKKPHDIYYDDDDLEDFDDEDISDYEKIVKIRKETDDDGLFIERVLNGRFAILSESGYIPDSIVKQLRNECEYSCNHMG